MRMQQMEFGEATTQFLKIGLPIILGSTLLIVVVIIILFKVKPDLICSKVNCNPNTGTTVCPQCPQCPNPPLPELMLISGNNGAATCDQYCNGHWGRDSLPATWKGASALIVGGTDPQNRIGVHPSATSGTGTEGSCLCIRDDTRVFVP